jgi:hypothetical protein
MGMTRHEIDDSLREFIQNQRIFFVATAPLRPDAHVNLSPKGLDSFRVLGPSEVGYVDYTGSGIETVAHVRENGRLTIMFCAFEGRADILRLYGKGRIVEPQDAEFSRIIGLFKPAAPVRSIVVLTISRITGSCGFGVPLYEYRGNREQLVSWSERKGAEGLRAYQKEKNAASIDGLPGLRWAGEAPDGT